MLGQSAGRSAGNRPRPGARRRSTSHEREVAKYTTDDPQQWRDVPDDTVPRYAGHIASAIGVMGMMIFTGVSDYIFGVVMIAGILGHVVFLHHTEK